MPPKKTSIDVELWRGANQIADGIGDKVYSVYRMLERGDLPAFKLNGQWCMRPSSYSRRLDELEAGEA